MRAAEILGPEGPFAAAMPDHEVRPAQLRMATAVEQALAHDGILLVEAGTGTGKTLAYLIPALLSGKRVVVSTGTRTLQDQIMNHDVPLLRRALGHDFAVACMKGLTNYLCLRRFEAFQQSPAAVQGLSIGARSEAQRSDPRTGGPGAASPGRGKGREPLPYKNQLSMLIDWEEQTETGDRAELSGLPEGSPLWAEVQSASETRIGARCKHYEACYVTRMRARAADAQLIVVNHHLFFADLAVKGAHSGGVIPDYDAVIFDEAHLVEDIATDFFGVSVSSTRLEVLVRDAERALSTTGAWLAARRPLDDLIHAGAAFFTALPRPTPGESGRVPLPRETFHGRVEGPLFALDAALEALAGLCQRESVEAESLTAIARRAQALRDDVATVAEGGAGKEVTWTAQRGRGVSIGSSPIEVGDILRDRLYQRAHATIMTSATLSTGGNFDFIKSRLGIDFEVDEELLPSPFDYGAQAALFLPEGLPDPREADFRKVASEHILGLVRVTGGGAFVLCTSIRAMRELSERCRGQLKKPVYVQGDAPNASLLAHFRDAGDAVLFATASFWQGVDVPGEALRLVVIDKLPFDVPSDPLVEARCQRLQAEGVPPFMKYLVPAAALSLKQGFGRLIRKRSDRGVVAILDRRLTTKGYGKVFLRSLPAARRCSTLAQVEAFWNETSG